MLHQLTPIATPYASVATRLDFVSGKFIKFGEQLVAVTVMALSSSAIVTFRTQKLVNAEQGSPPDLAAVGPSPPPVENPECTQRHCN